MEICLFLQVFLRVIFELLGLNNGIVNMEEHVKNKVFI